MDEFLASGADLEASFGNWVRRRRKALDLTQNELAQRVGCSSSLIYKIETDERRPSRQIAQLLATQLEIPTGKRETFLKVARQELAVLRMEDPGSMPHLERASKKPAPLERENQNLEEVSDQNKSSLPIFPTLFIGREHEIDIVLQQILDPACRLLTLTGPGGVGKTRLAVEVAHRLETTFTGGIYFLQMAGVELPESIVTEVANALGLSFSGPADQKMQVIQALRNKKALLLFDNMEHLVEGSAVLGDFLQQAPELRMLLTSRESIHLQWEWIFEVQGLPIPESARPDMLEANSAAALFLQRMRQAAPRSMADDESGSDDAIAIIQICKLVDGLPLAIELAASWARVMSPGEIAAELVHGLDLLETKLQDMPIRHRSIRMVFDHSWKLLTGEERTALMTLAVFSGGFTRDAAQIVAGASVQLLSIFVSKSLLRYGKQAGRYYFHELVRQYILERLSEQPDQEQAAYRRLAEYYADWLAGLEMPIKSGEQISVSARVHGETANWNAAWRWASGQKRLDLLRKMGLCLYWHYEIHGDNADAVSLMTNAVSELRKAGAPASLTNDFQKGTFALLVDQLGWFEFRMGNVERATGLFTESLEITQGMADRDHEALYYIHVNWGYMSLVTGSLEKAAHFTQASLEHARAIDGQWHAAVAINILGIIEYQRGQLEEAYRQLNGSLLLWREVGDPRGLVFCMLYLSAAALALGSYDQVERIVSESNAIARKKGDRWAHAFGLDLLGNVAVARGEFRPAIETFRQSVTLSQEIGDLWAATLSTIHLGEAHLANGDRSEAQMLFRKAYENARHARWLSTILDVLVASLTADEETNPEIRLAITLAVLSNTLANLPTRQRAMRLRDHLVATLEPQQVEAARSEALQRTTEDWASIFFMDSNGEKLSLAALNGEWSPGINPARQSLLRTDKS